MTNLPYLVTALCRPHDGVSEKGLQLYFDSLVNLHNKFEFVAMLYQPHIRVLIGGALAQFIRQYYVTTPYPGNLARFNNIDEVADGDMNPDRWIVFTDAFDVIWQGELPDFGSYDSSTVFYSSEGELWKDNSFFRGLKEKHNLTEVENLDEYDVACAGGFAMTVKNFRSFVAYTVARRDYYKDIMNISDQYMFNEWLWLYNGGVAKPYNHPSLFGTLHNNFNIGNIVKKDNKFYNREGELLTMVHANGSTKEILYGSGTTKDDNERGAETIGTASA